MGRLSDSIDSIWFVKLDTTKVCPTMTCDMCKYFTYVRDYSCIQGPPMTFWALPVWWFQILWVFRGLKHQGHPCAGCRCQDCGAGESCSAGLESSMDLDESWDFEVDETWEHGDFSPLGKWLGKWWFSMVKTGEFHGLIWDLPSGYVNSLLLKMVIYRGFSHW